MHYDAVPMHGACLDQVTARLRLISILGVCKDCDSLFYRVGLLSCLQWDNVKGASLAGN